ncbi:pyridoxal phosphate-dependent aminotransferase [Novosphingobium beihaiensis]|uniref:aspartate transaminase n=1 Tax=Novosphingobium beihaiensis TaxID=2930389 RepID=A0ABT0BRH2_9SPHN|nr:pyridoxal phosphate-dependent aminotransferase [Novosphingobium beihaiensis]MCJ2187657.1 pyridoxal phosphate-dependent aminotransferase [Novosphingobium beihaiensis]
MRYAGITDRLAGLGGEKWAIHNAGRVKAAAGEEIIELTIGEPDIPVDPELIRVCHESMLRGRTHYSNGRGESGLLDAIVDKYRPQYPGITTGNVLAFPGTQTALYAVISALVGEGEGVLIGDPYYATYEGVVRAPGAVVEAVPLKIENGFVMQPDDLRAAITEKSRVLLLNSPHNPTGALLDRDTIAELGKIACEHDLWIVSDEVYEDLIFVDEDFASPLEIEELRERTIVVSSISKTYAATGFRSGWAVGPAEFCDKLLPISETILFGNQPFIADMTEAALRGTFDTAERMCRSYASRVDLITTALASSPSLTAGKVSGGMFIMIDVARTGLDGEQFAWGLLEEQGVAIMPGTSFGENAKTLIRVALTVPGDVLSEAMKRINAFAASLADARQTAAAQ